MNNVEDAIKKIEAAAPPETAAEWDNSGFVVNLGKKTFSKIMTALSVTEDVVAQADKNGCDLIIAHHPPIFSPLRKIEPGAVESAVRKGIQIYCAHTNLDVMQGGTTSTLAEKCGFVATERVSDFTLGARGGVRKIDELIENIKKNLGAKVVKIVNPLEIQEFSSIAFCAGAGASELKAVEDAGFEVFVTGDVKYHEALESKIVIIDVGHFYGEKFVNEIFERILGVPTVRAEEKSPWRFV